MYLMMPGKKLNFIKFQENRENKLSYLLLYLIQTHSYSWIILTESPNTIIDSI